MGFGGGVNLPIYVETNKMNEEAGGVECGECYRWRGSRRKKRGNKAVNQGNKFLEES